MTEVLRYVTTYTRTRGLTHARTHARAERERKTESPDQRAQSKTTIITCDLCLETLIKPVNLSPPPPTPQPLIDQYHSASESVPTIVDMYINNGQEVLHKMNVAFLRSAAGELGVLVCRLAAQK